MGTGKSGFIAIATRAGNLSVVATEVGGEFTAKASVMNAAVDSGTTVLETGFGPVILFGLEPPCSQHFFPALFLSYKA
jgi:hypothetical protein